MVTVKNLRQSGWKVRVLHHRIDDSRILGEIFPKGGKTQVVIDSPVGEHFEGIAVCSDKDLYNKKMGVKIALGRALFNSEN